MLKLSEILEFFREQNINVTEEDIRNCEPTSVRRIFEFFIEIVMNVTKDELSQPDLSGLTALSYPDLHSESIQELSFYRAANNLMISCGVYDFTWKDVQKPTIKRLRRQISAVVNFSKFKQERMHALKEWEDKTVRATLHDRKICCSKRKLYHPGRTNQNKKKRRRRKCCIKKTTARAFVSLSFEKYHINNTNSNIL